MVEPVKERMTLDAFLVWDGEPDRRYQLFDGVPEAMPLHELTHGAMVAEIGARISTALSDRPDHWILHAAGIRPFPGRDTFYVADIAVTCEPLRADQQITERPILIVEVLSPPTEEIDRKVKLGNYRKIPSVAEIVLIDPNRPFAEVHRRHDDHQWLCDLYSHEADVLRVDTAGLSARLGELYRRILPISNQVIPQF